MMWVMSQQQQYKKNYRKNSFQVEKLCDVALKAAKHTFNTFLTPKKARLLFHDHNDINYR